MKPSSHVSVLLKEALEFLEPGPGKVFVDGTLGAGGHAESILERLEPSGVLIGFDRDPEALRISKERLQRFGRRLVMVEDNFANMKNRLKTLGYSRVDGMLLDLGLSSVQLSSPSRGFSFQAEAPLDMRMGCETGPTAREIVNTYLAKDLETIFGQWGEERFSRQIAVRIVEARHKKPIETTRELENIVFHAVPRRFRHGRTHPATRIFQAIRMEVNREMPSLAQFLNEAPECLNRGARLAIISFHSLEDRQVKDAFKRWQKEGLGRMLTKKPVQPTAEESRQNPRSRSAKLRVFEAQEEAVL